MKHQIEMTTTYTITVIVDADTREQAEEKAWELYNSEQVDPIDTYNIDTNAQWKGYADE